MKATITHNASLSEMLSSFDNKQVKIPNSWREIGAAIEEILQKKGITEIHLEIPEREFSRYTIGLSSQVNKKINKDLVGDNDPFSRT